MADVANATTSESSSTSGSDKSASAVSAALNGTTAQTETPEWYVPLYVGLRFNDGGNKELSLQLQICYSSDNCDFNSNVFSVTTGGIVYLYGPRCPEPVHHGWLRGRSDAKGGQATFTSFSGHSQFSIMVYEDITGIVRTVDGCML